MTPPVARSPVPGFFSRSFLAGLAASSFFSAERRRFGGLVSSVVPPHGSLAFALDGGGLDPEAPPHGEFALPGVGAGAEAGGGAKLGGGAVFVGGGAELVGGGGALGEGDSVGAASDAGASASASASASGAGAGAGAGAVGVGSVGAGAAWAMPDVTTAAKSVVVPRVRATAMIDPPGGRAMIDATRRIDPGAEPGR